MAATPDKIESVQKVGEAMGTKAEQFSEPERLAPNQERFDNLINSNSPIQTSFERVDSGQNPDMIETIEKNPIFTEDGSSSQKSGSATDQDGKKKRQDDDDSVGSISKTGSKKISSLESSSLGKDISQMNTQVGQMAKLSPEELKNQAESMIGKIEEAKTKLSQVSDIKPSYQTLLRNRLSHIDDNLKIALSKAGVEYTPPPVSTTADRGNPVKQFIDSLTGSQNQMQQVYQSIQTLSAEGKNLSATDMLTVQFKMNHVQQQIELFSNLLNKALESTKTIMNVQV